MKPECAPPLPPRPCDFCGGLYKHRQDCASEAAKIAASPDGPNRRALNKIMEWGAAHFDGKHWVRGMPPSPDDMNYAAQTAALVKEHVGKHYGPDDEVQPDVVVE